MMILAIESSCDETSVALVSGNTKDIRVIKNLVSSSAELQAKYGGVVPEIAAREQIKAIMPLIEMVLDGYKKDEIEKIAVAYGPGLMGSLLIGVETAKAISWAWDKPLIGVNHLVAHIAACFINDKEDSEWVAPKFPALGMVISGGHTDLVLMENENEWRWIGGTRDDAIGEAFDKAANILGLPYPGGPSIQRAIEELDPIYLPQNHVKLPRPMIRDNNLELSFSGLKAALNKATLGVSIGRMDVCWWANEFNRAACEVILSKLERANEIYHPESIIVAGGVSANRMIRESLIGKYSDTSPRLFIPNLKYCGDNAAMIGAAAILRPSLVSFDLAPDPSLGVV